MDKETPKIYKDLAERNNWTASFAENRLYFMKNGKYAIPDENTSKEDKILLANYISEGSEKLEELILNCWENGLSISGPCSGINEFHDKPPHFLHFGLSGPKNLILSLNESLIEIFPIQNHLIREEQDDRFKYDFSWFLNGITLSKEDSDTVFSMINDQLNNVIEKNNINKNTK